jgi:hypothetical protein
MQTAIGNMNQDLLQRIDGRPALEDHAEFSTAVNTLMRAQTSPFLRDLLNDTFTSGMNCITCYGDMHFQYFLMESIVELYNVMSPAPIATVHAVPQEIHTIPDGNDGNDGGDDGSLLSFGRMSIGSRFAFASAGDADDAADTQYTFNSPVPTYRSSASQ